MGGKYRYDQNRRKLGIIITSVCFILMLIIAVSIIIIDHFKTTSAPTSHKTVQILKQLPEISSTAITGRYLFSGTIAWDRAIERDAKGDYNRPFSNLDTFSPSKYDAWIADLECPVTNATIPYQTQVDKLIFNCPPAFDSAARKYFSILNLANNHAYDQGRAGYLETQQHLNSDGFQTFGGYDPADAQNICEVISLPIQIIKSDKSQAKSQLPVAFCAFHALSKFPTDSEMAVVAAYAKVMPVFAFGHLGVEYTSTATAQQERLAHEFVDAGAEFVIMNHPHWVQNTEVYKNKLIVYSTGNFIYDQLTYEEQRSASIDVQLSAQYDDNLAQWIDFGKTCSAEKLNDNCYGTIPAILVKPKINYIFDMVAGDERPPQRWLTRRADQTLQLDTEKRMNWLQTLNQLGQGQRSN